MWRCQWLELRIKDLLSQVAKYDKELAIINHEKDLQLEMMKADCPNSGLLQLDLQSHERNTMKRSKRKRDEDIMDSSLSTEKQLILSYYNGLSSSKLNFTEILMLHEYSYSELSSCCLIMKVLKCSDNPIFCRKTKEKIETDELLDDDDINILGMLDGFVCVLSIHCYLKAKNLLNA